MIYHLVWGGVATFGVTFMGDTTAGFHVPKGTPKKKMVVPYSSISPDFVDLRPRKKWNERCGRKRRRKNEKSHQKKPPRHSGCLVSHSLSSSLSLDKSKQHLCGPLASCLFRRREVSCLSSAKAVGSACCNATGSAASDCRIWIPAGS